MVALENNPLLEKSFSCYSNSQTPNKLNNIYDKLTKNTITMNGHAVFERHNQLCSEIDALSDVDRQLGQAQSNVRGTQQQIASHESQLSRNAQAKARLDKRIYRNENPRFLHYFVWNRQAKVERLKGEHGKLVEHTSNLDAQLPELRESLASLNSDLSQVASRKSNRDAMAQERQQIFDNVVAASPSPRLKQIQSNCAAQSQAIAKEKALVAQIDACVSSVRNGQGLYQQARMLTEKARQMNTVARVVNQEEMREWSHEERREHERRMHQMERQLQAQRDQAINDATIPASQGYQVISQAWTIFPQEARARYPQQSAKVGHTPLPQLQSASHMQTTVMDFMGEFGEAINNANSEGKIRNNLGVISQCIQIIESQLQLINALRSAIVASITTMENNLQTLNQQEQEERVLIFQHQKSMALSNMGPSQSQPLNNHTSPMMPPLAVATAMPVS